MRPPFCRAPTRSGDIRSGRRVRGTFVFWWFPAPAGPGRVPHRSAHDSWSVWATSSNTRSSAWTTYQLRRAASFKRSCRWRSRPSRLLDQLLNPIGDLLALAFAAGDDQDRIISGDGSDDLIPTSLVQRFSDGTGRAAGSLEYEKRSHPVYAEQQCRQDQAQLGVDDTPMRVGIEGTPSGIGQLCQTQLANISRQGGLSHLEALFYQRLSEPILAL